MRAFPLLLCLALPPLVTACVANQGLTVDRLAGRADGSGFRPLEFPAGEFRLAALLRDSDGPDDTLVVYLEGDGRAVRNGAPTLDPTPSRAQSYELALLDPAPQVLYLARIGQYQPEQTGRAYQAYWSDERLGEAAVRATMRALDQALELTGARCLHLVGYSGGGGLATLVAQRRADVLSLVSVAGLLDTEWWTREGNYRPLTGHNPADRAYRLRDLPQLHFYADKDGIVPPGVSASYLEKALFSRARRIRVRGDHWSQWTEMWPELLRGYVLPLRENAAAKASVSALPPRALWAIFAS